ncbi:hypothetical protein Ae201684P_021606 [Aphanomyces euteiches]|uniref:NAD(+) ADP-ribosyltransferase n=1 Tax=Aphanomyces euteiches TaxID=100861 RepID=A0A6G0X6Z8_9STRA|nr:hypothetical protein Ae201684_007782 [Aphanomyces euteiches]KAH9067449.1 hypothetical protein Ae201684P_021606 [Aphanomyces euteiches]KAH9148483.1 hypothetical protein AeRB84_008179 [Aphanomyces euteiches]
MAITRSSKVKKSGKPSSVNTGTCTCIWCKTWKPRKVYKTKKYPPKPKTTTKKPAPTSVKFNPKGSIVISKPTSWSTASKPLNCIEDDGTLDAKLVLVNLADNMDEFFNMQAVFSIDGFFVSTKWGHTGTNGQSKLEGPMMTLEEATTKFYTLFHEKTGNLWSNRKSFVKMDGKYDLLNSTSATQASGPWEYYMDDFVDGKATGWYPYTAEGTTQTELLYQTHLTNSAYNRRIVQSGYFKYCIDLDEMTQTNIKTNKRRQIRRV